MALYTHREGAGPRMNIWQVHANKVVSVADAGIKKGGFLKDNECVAPVILSAHFRSNSCQLPVMDVGKIPTNLLQRNQCRKKLEAACYCL